MASFNTLTYSTLAMKEQICEIEIKNLRLRTIIGFNDWEREKKQDVIISVRFRYNAARAVAGDEVSEIVNYRTMTKQIIQKVEKSDFKLIESLTGMIYDTVRSAKGVTAASVTVEKPHALRFCDNLISRISDYE